MKKYFPLIYLLFTFGSVFPQCYEEGDKVIGSGIQMISLAGEETTYGFLPLCISGEYVFTTHWLDNKLALSGGIEAGYFEYKLYTGTYQVEKASVFASLHYSFTPYLEAFAGLKPGYYFDSYNNEIAGLDGYKGLNNEAFLGTRWYIIPHLGVYARVLTSNVYTEFGVSVKF